MSTPLASLLIFFSISFLGYLLFRPGHGYYWRFRKGAGFEKKVLKEDLLKLLYHAEYKNEAKSIIEIQDFLKTSNSEFNDIVTNLLEENLISNTGQTLKLTKKGSDYALKIIRAHRLYEKYLSEKTGFDKLQWHDMAEDMEHKMSNEETEKLSSQLGSPHFDPHGDPIPTKSGGIIAERGTPLYDLPENAYGKIIHIEDEPEAVYKQILAEDLHIGSQVRIIESNKLRVKFYCEGKEYILTNEVAANLTVIELTVEDQLEVIRLSALLDHEVGIVKGISRECRGANRRRLLDLGFVPGTEVSIGLVSPMNDPRAYRLRSTDIALRSEQAKYILIKKENKKEDEYAAK